MTDRAEPGVTPRHDYRPDPRREGMTDPGPCYFLGCGRESWDSIHPRALDAATPRPGLAAKRAIEQLPFHDCGHGYVISRSAALDAAARATSTPAGLTCGCTVDAELGAGPVCPACGHRDHGRSGCRAALQGADR